MVLDYAKLEAFLDDSVLDAKDAGQLAHFDRWDYATDGQVESASEYEPEDLSQPRGSQGEGAPSSPKASSGDDDGDGDEDATPTRAHKSSKRRSKSRGSRRSSGNHKSETPAPAPTHGDDGAEGKEKKENKHFKKDKRRSSRKVAKLPRWSEIETNTTRVKSNHFTPTVKRVAQGFGAAHTMR